MGGRGSNGNRNLTNSQFGNPGIYSVYRAGGIFESPLGYLSFGLNKSQSVLYEEARNAPIEAYTLRVKNPLYVTGTDFDTMQEDLAVRFVGRSYTEGNTLEEQRAIMRSAAKEMEKQGYDAILMRKVNKLSGKEDFEIGVLNGKRQYVIRRKR